MTPQEIYDILEDSILKIKKKNYYINDGLFGLKVNREGYYKLEGLLCCPIGSFLAEKRFMHSFTVDAAHYLGIRKDDVDMIIRGFDSSRTGKPRDLKTYFKVGRTLRKFI